MGNFFIVLGIGIFAGRAWLTLLAVALFAAQYYFIVIFEENLLGKKFGEEFEAYLKSVPPWVPKKLPKLEEVEWPSTFSPAIKSEKRTLTAIILMVLFILLFA